jgi:hypothetical protein
MKLIQKPCPIRYRLRFHLDLRTPSGRPLPC